MKSEIASCPRSTLALPAYDFVVAAFDNINDTCQTSLQYKQVVAPNVPWTFWSMSRLMQLIIHAPASGQGPVALGQLVLVGPIVWRKVAAAARRDWDHLSCQESQGGGNADPRCKTDGSG